MNIKDQERIKEIDKKIEELSEEWSKLRKEHEKIILGDKNYEGKFIYDDMRGYMYVTWQTIDKCLKDGEVMLQGLTFYSDSSEDYRDMAMFHFNALEEWYISINTFLSDDNGIKIISKEDFMNAYKEGFNGSFDFGLMWINEIINKDDCNK